MNYQESVYSKDCCFLVLKYLKLQQIKRWLQDSYFRGVTQRGEPRLRLSNDHQYRPVVLRTGRNWRKHEFRPSNYRRLHDWVRVPPVMPCVCRPCWEKAQLRHWATLLHQALSQFFIFKCQNIRLVKGPIDLNDVLYFVNSLIQPACIHFHQYMPSG